MAFPFHSCKEVLNISLTIKSESCCQLNFDEFETSFHIRKLYWNIMLYLFVVFLVHVTILCVFKMGYVVILQ